MSSSSITPSGSTPAALHLKYIAHHPLRNDPQGLIEPSGLALARDPDGFWTVSDDTDRIFRLWLDGSVDIDRSFRIGETGLEGIVELPGGDFLLAIKEETNELLHIDIAGRKVIARKKLSEMAGFDAVAEHFDEPVGNKGLEGITIRPSDNAIFVLKEGRPGLLAEISPDLTTLVDHRILSGANGFDDDAIASRRIDYSGLTYDRQRHVFWIVSDKAKRLFLYDWHADAVRQSAPLAYELAGEPRLVRKAEGVALDLVADRLYVVQDQDAPDDDVNLFVFAIDWDDSAP